MGIEEDVPRLRLPIVAGFKIRKPGGVSLRSRSWILWFLFILMGLALGIWRTPPPGSVNPAAPPVSAADRVSQDGAVADGTGGPAQTGDAATGSTEQAESQVRLVSYVIQSGDTLSSIAGRFNTTSESIAYINQLASPDRISVGKEISVMENASGVVARVASGDTLWDIAERYGIEVNQIASANNLPSAEDIQVGQVLLLPGVSPTSRPAQVLSRSSSFIWPVSGSVTDDFGWRIHPVTGDDQFHEGIDIAAPTGTDIKAASSGTVTFAGWSGGYGRLVIVSHPNGSETRYGHLSGFEATTGEWVSVGQVIGYVGQSGDATGPHCHFEVRKNGTPLDPEDYLP